MDSGKQGGTFNSQKCEGDVKESSPELLKDWGVSGTARIMGGGNRQKDERGYVRSDSNGRAHQQNWSTVHDEIT